MAAIVGSNYNSSVDQVLLSDDTLYPMVAKETIVGPWGEEMKFYKFRSLLGKGTFCIVYEALCLNEPQELVAIKINRFFEVSRESIKKVYKNLSTEYAETLLEESAILKAAQGPHIVVLKGSGVSLDTFKIKEVLLPITYVILEKVGPTLRELRDDNVIEISKITTIFKQTLLALNHLHNHAKVTHCDLKPDNISLSLGDELKVKIIDFNAAVKDIETQGLLGNRTTRWYRAPEYFLKLSLTPSIDIWGLACTIVELITGFSLFRSSKFADHAAKSNQYFGMFPKDMLERSSCYQKAFIKEGEDFKLKQQSTYDPSALERFIQPYFEGPHEDKLPLYLNLLNKMFIYNPSERITAEEALKDPLFST